MTTRTSADKAIEHDDRCCMTVAGATGPHYDCPGVVALAFGAGSCRYCGRLVYTAQEAEWRMCASCYSDGQNP